MRLFVGILVVLGILSAIMAIPLRNRQETDEESQIRAQRQANGGHHHDAVDFGAHTGDHGAFGWYADFPVHGGH